MGGWPVTIKETPVGAGGCHELGLKSELLDRRVRLKLAGYYNIVTNIQRTTLIATPSGIAGILGNAGKVRIWGLEAELLVVPLEGLQLGATGALTRPKYLDYQDLSGDRRRERFELVPRHSFSLSATYTGDLGFGSLLLRTDYSWQDKMSLNAFNNPANANNAAIIAATTAPASGVLNARDNRDRVTALLVPEPIGFVQGTFREPRTFGVTGTFRFGDR